MRDPLTHGAIPKGLIARERDHHSALLCLMSNHTLLSVEALEMGGIQSIARQSTDDLHSATKAERVRIKGPPNKNIFGQVTLLHQRCAISTQQRETPRETNGNHGNQWKPVEINGKQGKPMEIKRNKWKLTETSGNGKQGTNTNGNQRKPMETKKHKEKPRESTQNQTSSANPGFGFLQATPKHKNERLWPNIGYGTYPGRLPFKTSPRKTAHHPCNLFGPRSVWPCFSVR